MKSGSCLPAVAGREASVHLALFPDMAEIVPGGVADLEDDWASCSLFASW